jgi:cytochrome c oxidase assembly protein subunit 16
MAPTADEHCSHQRLQGLGGDDAALSGTVTPSQLAAADVTPTRTEAALAERKKKKKNFFDTTSQDEYEPVRVPRPAGMPEWGAMPSSGDAPVKGSRPEDRWV